MQPAAPHTSRPSPAGSLAVPALVDGLVDYAGLFPPASLSLAEAVSEYASYLDRPDAAMLGRFIVPATRLDELTALLRPFDAARPLRLSLLAPPGTHATDVALAVGYARATSDAFADSLGGRVRVEAFETRPSERELGATGLPDDLLGRAAALASPRPLYVELPFARRPDAARAWLDAIGRRRAAGDGTLCAKIRCGGEAAGDIPATAVVAGMLRRCIDLDVPFKATAGLHHPVRHTRADGVEEHGFLNVFAAAVLGRALRLGIEDLVPILEERDASSFTAAGGGLRWRGLSASRDETLTARRTFAHAFGSCSFDEPTDDLRALSWLEPLAVPAT